MEDDLKAMSKNFKLASSDLEESKNDAATAWRKWDVAIANNEKLFKKKEKMEFMKDEALREGEEDRVGWMQMPIGDLETENNT